MADLYDGCDCCRDLVESTHVSSAFSFDESAIADALKRIYETDFNPMTDIEENLFRETWKTLNNAVDVGVKLSAFNPEDEFINQLKTNNAVFSAFRVHRMQNDIAAKLITDDGKLKPFSQFVADTRKITDHHVNDWLRTEYDTAVIRAHNAADWKQYEAEKDVLPNLEWLPSTSVTPGEDHRPFWGVVYPVNAAFWRSHKPGDRWNCKCRLQATDKAIHVAPKEGRDLKYAPATGLENNPAKDGKIFSDTHPYRTKTYPGAKKAVNKFIKELSELSKDSQNLYEWTNSLIKNPKPKGELKQVGRVEKVIKQFAKAHKNPFKTSEIMLEDRRVLHMCRPNKKHSPTVSDIAKIKGYLNQASIYFDRSHNNYLYFVKQQNGVVLKFSVEPNYVLKHNGERKVVNYISTGGYVPERDLGKTDYIKIKD